MIKNFWSHQLKKILPTCSKANDDDGRRRILSKGTIGATKVPFLFAKAQDYNVMQTCGNPLIPLSRNSIKRLMDEFEVAVPSRRKRKSRDPHQKVKGTRPTSLLWLTHY